MTRPGRRAPDDALVQITGLSTTSRQRRASSTMTSRSGQMYGLAGRFAKLAGTKQRLRSKVIRPVGDTRLPGSTTPSQAVDSGIRSGFSACRISARLPGKVPCAVLAPRTLQRSSSP